MNNSTLAIINAVLFVVQAIFNIIFARRIIEYEREYETLITPASFAFAIWIVIYALELLLVITDVFYPHYSLYADASQPMQLRFCFALSCVFNIAWVLFFATRHVHMATLMIFLLWFALLALYIYTVNDRQSRGTSDWRLYCFNELPITMYFGWVTISSFIQLAISLQHRHQDFLGTSAYVILLTILIVIALIAMIHARESIVSMVMIWFLIALAVKQIQVPSGVEIADTSVRACAAQGAGILALLLITSWTYMTLWERKNDGSLMQGTGNSSYGTNA